MYQLMLQFLSQKLVTTFIESLFTAAKEKEFREPASIQHLATKESKYELNFHRELAEGQSSKLYDP